MSFEYARAALGSISEQSVQCRPVAVEFWSTQTVRSVCTVKGKPVLLPKFRVKRAGTMAVHPTA